VGQSRGVIASVVIALSFVVPGAICLGVVLLKPGSFVELAIGTFAAVVWMALLFLVNWWEFTGLWLRWLWLLVLGVAIASRAVVATDLQVTAPVGPLTAIAFVVGGFGAWLLARALYARQHSGEAIRLAVPFSAGRFLVTDGGDGARSFLVNYHYGFGRHRSSGVGRSMRYAMDVVEIGATGSSAHGFLPRRNDAYRCWGRPLLAPCDGVVAHVENGIEDNAAFGSHRPYGVGNHVVIQTSDDVYVVAGHLQRASVCVVRGDAVRAGDRIGAVGNSGWTERPHLHMQATRTSTGDWWHGDPVPMEMDGRFLVRNESFRVDENPLVLAGGRSRQGA
jgi:hypothetical protein